LPFEMTTTRSDYPTIHVSHLEMETLFNQSMQTCQSAGLTHLSRTAPMAAPCVVHGLANIVRWTYKTWQRTRTGASYDKYHRSIPRYVQATAPRCTEDQVATQPSVHFLFGKETHHLRCSARASYVFVAIYICQGTSQ